MSSSPPIVCIKTAAGSCGTGVWVAREFVLTAWHVVSTVPEDPDDHGAQAVPAASIEIFWKGEKVALRRGGAIDVRFATREHSGSPLDVDLALLNVPLASSSPLREVAPLPLALGLLGAAGDMLVAGGSSTLEYHGFPSKDPRAPTQRDFRPAEWKPNTRDSEPDRCGLTEPGVQHGYSGGPLLARVGERSHWVGVVSLGGYNVAHSAFVLTGAIQRFLAAVARSGDFHGFSTPATTSLHDALLDDARKKVVERCDKLYWSSSVKLNELYVERVVELSPGADATPIGKPLALESHLRDGPEPGEAAPRLVLVAEPGLGKSTLLRHLAWKFASTTGAPRFAIDARLPSLRDGGWSRAALYEHVEKRCGGYPRHLLECGDPRGQLALLLDGYDEVDASGAGLDQMDDLLRDLANTLPRTPILLASRPPFEVRELEAYKRLGVQPLDQTQQFALLKGIVTRLRKARRADAPAARIGERELERWVQAIQTDSRYSEDRGNPLWLTLAAGVVASRDELPGSRVKLLQRIIEDLADRLHDRNPDAKPSKVGDRAPAGWREVLEALAYRMTDTSRVQLTLRELGDWLSSPRHDSWSFAPDFARRVDSLREGFSGQRFPDAFVAWLSERSILAPTESVDDARSRLDEPHAFWHRSIQEHLTARELRRIWDSRDGRGKVLKIANDAAQKTDEALLERLAAAVERLRPARNRLRAEYARDAFSFETDEERRRDFAQNGRDYIESWISSMDGVGDALGLRRTRSLPSHSDTERFWGEPLGMLAAELTPDQAQLLFDSLARTPIIARRALQSVDAATEVTIRRVLRELSEAEERGQVLLQAPRLVPSSERALALLVELGRAPAQRADVYFIDEALFEVARLDPSLEPRCREATKRMYCDLVRVEPRSIAPSLTLICVPKGPHKIGERAEREVDPAPFRIGAVTVTRAEYRRFDPDYAPSHSPQAKPKKAERLPAYEVSWYEATAYARWLGWVLEGEPGRLPTEVEWEIACRAGTTTRWNTGDDEAELSAAAHFGKGERDGPFEVGQLAPNDWGLFDMHGNVWEWCSDLYERGPRRVVRGGGYWNTADDCRSAYRGGSRPAFRIRGTGFRVVLPAAPARGSSLDL